MWSSTARGPVRRALCTFGFVLAAAGQSAVASVATLPNNPIQLNNDPTVTYAWVSGEIQNTTGRFSGVDRLSVSGNVSFDSASVSTFVNVPQGVMGASAQALARGVTNATADFRNRSVVLGSGSGGGEAVLHVTLNPTMWMPSGGSLNPNNSINLTFSYRMAGEQFGGIELRTWASRSDGECSAAFLFGHTRQCISPNQGTKSFDISFKLPESGSWLALEGDFWFQAIDGAQVSLGEGVQLSLTLPEGVQLVNDFGTLPMTTVPELSTQASFLMGGLALMAVMRKKRAQA